MRVAWTARDSGPDPAVQWSLRAEAWEQGAESSNTDVTTVRAQGSTFNASTLCGPPANGQGWRDPGTLLTATIVGLPPRGGRVWFR